jgi:hypothetical protein
VSTRFNPVVSEETVAQTQALITAAYGSAGQSITSAVPTESVRLKNWNQTSYGIEYQIGSADWLLLPKGTDITLAVDLSVTTLKVRRSENAFPTILVDVEMNPKSISDPTRIVISSAAPSDSDGRPEGTIYIQTA